MGQLLRLLADRMAPGGAVVDRVLGWPGEVSSAGDAVALRLAGGLHALKRQGRCGLAEVYPPNEATDAALWAAVGPALEDEPAFILDWLASPPQTNEVRRAAALIPALHLIVGHFGFPLALTEIGCAAGLNLNADRFRLLAGDTAYGPEGSPLTLTPDWTGLAPAPADLTVTDRLGIDRAPVDPATGAERLIAYLWPDQPDRIARTEAAIGLALAHPATLVQCDAVDWLRDNAAPLPGQAHVLYHTIAWQYLPETARREGDRLIAAAGAQATPDAPLARFAMEADGDAAALRLRVWPGGLDLCVGRADYHGRWIRWDVPSLEEAEP